LRFSARAPCSTWQAWRPRSLLLRAISWVSSQAVMPQRSRSRSPKYRTFGQRGSGSVADPRLWPNVPWSWRKRSAENRGDRANAWGGKAHARFLVALGDGVDRGRQRTGVGRRRGHAERRPDHGGREADLGRGPQDRP